MFLPSFCKCSSMDVLLVLSAEISSIKDNAQASFTSEDWVYNSAPKGSKRQMVLCWKRPFRAKRLRSWVLCLGERLAAVLRELVLYKSRRIFANFPWWFNSYTQILLPPQVNGGAFSISKWNKKIFVKSGNIAPWLVDRWALLGMALNVHWSSKPDRLHWER